MYLGVIVAFRGLDRARAMRLSLGAFFVTRAMRLSLDTKSLSRM